MSSPKTPFSRGSTWTADDLGAFVEQVSDDRFFAMWMLITTTGMQLDALTGLERHDVDFEERRITPEPTAVRGGTRSLTAHRSYALDPTAYDALKEHVITWDKERYVLGQDTQKLFVWSNGEQIDGRSIRSMFVQHCSAARVPVVSLQEARQSYVTAAIETGMPVKVMSERLGHTVEPRNLRAVPSVESTPGADGAGRTRGRSRSCRSRSF